MSADTRNEKIGFSALTIVFAGVVSWALSNYAGSRFDSPPQFIHLFLILFVPTIIIIQAMIWWPKRKEG